MLRKVASWFAVLAGGVAVGSALAVAVLGNGPHVWIDTLILLAGADNADEPWLLRGEWRIAVLNGWLIAALCVPVWMMILRRGKASYRSAAILGTAMTAPFAAAWLHSADMEVTTLVDGIGLAAAGAASFAINQRLANARRQA